MPPGTSARRSAYTITITGTERLDGEKPYDYVLHARHAAHAVTKAARLHLFYQEESVLALTTSDIDGLPEIHISDIAVGVPAYPVDTPGRYWNDLRRKGPLAWLNSLLGRSS